MFLDLYLSYFCHICDISQLWACDVLPVFFASQNWGQLNLAPLSPCSGKSAFNQLWQIKGGKGRKLASSFFLVSEISHNIWQKNKGKDLRGAIGNCQLLKGKHLQQDLIFASAFDVNIFSERWKQTFSRKSWFSCFLNFVVHAPYSAIFGPNKLK